MAQSYKWILEDSVRVRYRFYSDNPVRYIDAVELMDGGWEVTLTNIHQSGLLVASSILKTGVTLQHALQLMDVHDLKTVDATFVYLAAERAEGQTFGRDHEVK